MEFLFMKKGVKVATFEAEPDCDFYDLEGLVEYIYDNYGEEIINDLDSDYADTESTFKEIEKNLYVDDLEIAEFLEDGNPLYTCVTEMFVLDIVEFEEVYYRLDKEGKGEPYVAYCNHLGESRSIRDFQESYIGEYDGWGDYGLNVIESCYNLPESLYQYFDFKEFGEGHIHDGYYLLEDKYVFS